MKQKFYTQPFMSKQKQQEAQKDNVFISSSNSKVTNYRTSDVINNMIATNLLKTKKCYCVNQRTKIHERTAYDEASFMNTSAKNNKTIQQYPSTTPHTSQEVKDNIKELLTLQTRIKEKISRIMKGREQKFTRNKENMQGEKEMLMKILGKEKKDTLSGSLQRNLAIKRLFEIITCKKQQNDLQEIEENLESSNDMSLDFSQEEMHKKSHKSTKQFKFMKKLKNKNFQEILTTQTRKHTWNAFGEYERYQQKNNHTCREVKPQRRRKREGKIKQKIRYVTEGQKVIEDYLSPEQRMKAFREYSDRFSRYVEGFRVGLNDMCE